MATQSPPWRRLLDAVESRAAGPLEELTKHEAFGVAVSITYRTVSSVRDQTERASRRALHLVNVPAASDINRLLSHIASVERELRELRTHVALESAGDPARRAPTRPRARAAAQED